AAYVAEHADLEEKTAAALRAYDWSTFVQRSDLKLAGSDPTSFLQLACADYEASDGDMPVETFALVVGLSLRPLLQAAAKTVMDMLDLKDGQTVHDKPLHCPACGSLATTSFVGDTPSNSGRGRILYCEYCGTEWEFERVRCACCGTHDQNKLHYFHIEGDEAHRLHNCEACGDYMRTVFRDDTVEVFAFEVEDVVMTRLDMVANDPRFSV
ncbi:MAG: formate dehydrogenase accessory protein FdhE, partial [Actinobacteria bacterium]|nr:formate dehydrogenase accessory protein FdhE [Actinomycetota bacterium]